MRRLSVKQLLKRRQLSGSEAGPIILQEYVRRLNGEPTLFKPHETQHIVDAITTERQLYNAYVRLGRILFTQVIILDRDCANLRGDLIKFAHLDYVQMNAAMVCALRELEGWEDTKLNAVLPKESIAELRQLIEQVNELLNGETRAEIEDNAQSLAVSLGVVRALAALVDMQLTTIQPRVDYVLGHAPPSKNMDLANRIESIAKMAYEETLSQLRTWINVYPDQIQIDSFQNFVDTLEEKANE